MKKIILLLALLVAASCSNDSNTPLLRITVISVESLRATISWTLENSDGPTLYRIILEGEVIEEGFEGNQYTFINLQDDTAYSGVVFAISQSGEETFQEFSFDTPLNLNFQGNYTIDSQEQLDDFYFNSISGSLTLLGSDITDASNLTSLNEVGGIRIILTSLQNLNGLQNVTSFTDGTGGVLIRDNPLLTNVSGLQNISDNINDLTLIDMSSLLDFTGLGIHETGATITIENCLFDTIDFLSNASSLAKISLIDMPNLTSLIGLNGLETIEGDLSLDNLENLLNLDGLNSLTNVGGVFEMMDMPIFELNALSNVTNLGQGIFFFQLPNIQTIQPLENASMTDGSLGIFRMPQLETLDGLNGVQNVTDLALYDLINLSNIDGLSNLQNMIRDFNNQSALSVVNCPLLTNLDGLSNLTQMGDSGTFYFLNVRDNDNLSDFCGLTNFALSVDSFQQIRVKGNLYNPNINQIRSETECSL